ncbi:transcription factor MYB58 [Lactuca sativa]|uniref:Uncharacterized protein n=1 Tax=Lactuca sativa TaxID=4236 RepID=A0A9R1XL63_LACSA|nr:transcription factor MYB58 [Lactuca sativa]KAJ0217236.1 hypothetical protein LSAT_V11C300117290 [Lactuca sativa]
MAKAPRFNKNGVKKGAWSEDEDNKLRAYIQRYGHWNWRLLPQFAGLSRSGKSCRLRWMNYLRPNIKHGNFTKEEEDIIVELHNKLGNKWSEMAAYLPGRSDNEIKNRWHTHLKKRSQIGQTMLQSEHVGNQKPNHDIENPVENSELELQHDLEILLTESPLSSSSSSLSSYLFNGSDSGATTQVTPQLVDYKRNFWTEPFSWDIDSILSSSDDNFFSPSNLFYPVCSQDMIMDEFLSSSLDSYLEYNDPFIN